ncbi:Peptide methionine sulfoxide reductase MsrA [Labeo rohita]|uniref:Peptide methionine sulfoxide reductase MsrA n=1 Tax=Labeo rohita TaxID=84645 RepID=A0ABQ8LQE8_LABRO|nr:Peptide methionine sulfoxide reductase MsrA [Labeo rohita]
MQACLSPAQFESSSLQSRIEGQSLTVKQFQQLLGLMAAASNMIPFGLLYIQTPTVVAQDQAVLPEGKSILQHQGHVVIPTCLGHVEEALVTVSGPGAESSLSPCNASDGYVSHRSRSGHEWPPCPWSVEWLPSHMAHQLPGDAGHVSGKHFLPDLRDHHVLVSTHNTALVYYINHQGDLRSCTLYKLDKLLSLRAVYVPGHLNMGADILSRQGQRPREWMLHPEMVKQIWRVFGQAQLPWGWMPWYRCGEASSVRLCPDCFAPGSSGESAPEGAHLIASGLSTEVVETILQSRAPSTRKLYALKWRLFTSWCGHRQQDPVNWYSAGVSAGSVLRRVSPLHPKGLRVAISAYHAPLGGSSVGRNPLVTRFLHGALRLRLLARLTPLEVWRPPGPSRQEYPSLTFQRCGSFHATHFCEILSPTFMPLWAPLFSRPSCAQ